MKPSLDKVRREAAKDHELEFELSSEGMSFQGMKAAGLLNGKKEQDSNIYPFEVLNDAWRKLNKAEALIFEAKGALKTLEAYFKEVEKHGNRH